MKNRRHYNFGSLPRILLIKKKKKKKEDWGKNKKGIDPELNEIVSCGKKAEKNVPCTTQNWHAH